MNKQPADQEFGETRGPKVALVTGGATNAPVRADAKATRFVNKFDQGK